MWRNQNLHTLLVRILKGTGTSGNILKFIKWLNINIPHNPAIPFLGIYLGEMKTYVHTKL